MKKISVLVAILFAAIFCQAQNKQQDTASQQPPALITPAIVGKALNEAYQKFGEDAGKFLTKEHWDATMNILSVYLKAALDAVSKKEQPAKKEPAPANKN